MFILLTSMFILMIVINSCKKEVNEATEQGQSILKEGSSLIFEDSIYLVRIDDFEQKIQPYIDSANYTSNLKYSLVDALWNIESYFNAKYARNMDYYTQTEVEKDSITIQFDNFEDVLLDDIVEQFQELYSINYGVYQNSLLSYKKFLLTDLEIVQRYTNHVVVEVTTFIGSKNQTTVQAVNYDGDDYFGEDDDWWYGYLIGDCDLLEEEGTDAAVKITEAIYNTTIVTDQYCDCIKWSDVAVTDLVGNEYDDENGDYLLFYLEKVNNNFTWEEKCLNPDEMNFHFHGTWEVIETLEQDLGLQYAYAHNLEGINDYDPQSMMYRIRHKSSFTHGKRHCLPASQCPDILDISVDLFD